MSSSEVLIRRQNRANFFGAMTKQQDFNLGITNHLRGANQPSTTSGLLSASDGKTDVTPNEQALTLAKNLGLTNQILFFENLVSEGIATSIEAVEFNQVALSNPETAIEEYSQPSAPPIPPPSPYNPSGIAEWATSFYLQQGSILNNTNSSIAIDSLNNIYILGTYIYNATQILKNLDGTNSSVILPLRSSFTATYLIKYNSSGIVQWATYLAGSGATIGWSLTTDSSNSVYLSGQYSSTTLIPIFNGLSSGSTYTSSGISLPTVTSAAVFLIKYNTSGIAQWATYFNGTGTDIGYSLTTDSQNNIYITGQYISTSTVPLFDGISSGSTYTTNGTSLASASTVGVFLLKYNSSGVMIWSNCFDATASEVSLAVKTDSNNNVYITGFFSAAVGIRNAITRGSGSTYPLSGISLNSSGFILTGFAMFLIKYNSLGVAQRAAIINGADGPNANEQGNGIAIDSNNNIYITGQYGLTPIIYDSINSGSSYTASSITLTPSTGTGTALFIVKYDSVNMNPVWATCIDDATSSLNSESGLAIAKDSSDNIYVTGFARISNPIALQNASGNGQSPSSIILPTTIINDILTTSIILVKYDSNGIAQWATYINGTQNAEQGQSISIDSNNTIYIGGAYSSYGDIILNDVSGNEQVSSSNIIPAGVGSFLAKYNSSGISQQVLNINSISTTNTSLGNYSGTSLVRDSLDNVYVTGNFSGNAGSFVLNADGTVSSIAIPATGTANSIFIIKYNSSGIAQWATYFINLNSTTTLTPSLAIDSNDNIYITSIFSRGGSTPITLFNAITSGSIFVASSISIPAVTINSSFIIKYNSSGVVQWANYFAGTGGGAGTVIGNGLGIDSSNNIYLAAQYTQSFGLLTLINANTGSGYTTASVSLQPIVNGAALIKYNSNGVVQWATYLDGTGSDYGQAVKTDSEGNVYFSGGYTSSGTVNILNGITSGSTYPSSGILLPSAGNTGVFLIKYTSSGVAQWATHFRAASFTSIYILSIDSLNNVYITGTYSSLILTSLFNAITSGSTYPSAGVSLRITTGNSGYILKFNSSGVLQWANVVDFSGSDQTRNIAIDSLNNIYIVGEYQSSSTNFLYNAITSGSVYPQSLVSLPFTNNLAVLLVKYNSSGVTQWATYLDATTNTGDSGISVVVDSTNKIYITGSYASPAPLSVNNVNGNGQIPSSITLDPIFQTSGAFLIKYG
jgi:hypothetical protein